MDREQVTIKEVSGPGTQSSADYNAFLANGLTFVLCREGQIHIGIKSKDSLDVRSGQIVLLLGYCEVAEVDVSVDAVALTVHFDASFFFSSLVHRIYNDKGSDVYLKRNHKCLISLLFNPITLSNFDDVWTLAGVLKNNFNRSKEYDYRQALCETFVLVMELYLPQESEISNVRTSNIAFKFLLSALKDFNRLKSVAQFADDCKISRSTLITEVRKQTGYTPSQIIDILTAERIYTLRYTGMSDVDIATEMRFSSASNMRRFLNKNSLKGRALR
ncbi:MAG: AraC family transcriptional regulator [Bacteroidales bacterium]|nr:AraC family transcriptional regulator [Bacteroidales bacterium]